MLSLGRKQGEALVFQCPDGTTFKVIVYRIGPGVVRLSTDAPLSVKVFREEIFETTQEPQEIPS